VRSWLVTSARMLGRLADDRLYGYPWEKMVGAGVDLTPAERPSLSTSKVNPRSSGPGLAWFHWPSPPSSICRHGGHDRASRPRLVACPESVAGRTRAPDDRSRPEPEKEASPATLKAGWGSLGARCAG
jgi:hypothetical protein